MTDILLSVPSDDPKLPSWVEVPAAQVTGIPDSPDDIGAATAEQGALADATKVQQVTLTAPLAYTLPTGLPSGVVHRVTFTQDASGGHTVTYGGAPVTVALMAGASTTVELHPVGAGYVLCYPQGGTVAWLPPSNGTDDTAAIQSVLDGNAGRRIVAHSGQSYKIRGPLAIQSGTVLDVTGSTVTLVSGSSVSHMLHNAAAVTARSVSGVAATAGSATLTGSAGSFTADDVGQPIRVWYPDGECLDTTVATYTSATEITLTDAPAYTVTTVVSIGARDHDIQIIGGHWVRELNGLPPLTGPGNTTLHSLAFRRVDGLTVHVETLSVAGGKYAISLADASQFHIAGTRFLDTASDGVHLNGAVYHGVIERLTGRTHDDMVGITPNDSAIGFGWSADVDGHISGITIRDCVSGMTGNEDSNTVAAYGDASDTYQLTNIRISRCAAADRFYARAVLIANGSSGVTIEDTLGMVRIGNTATSTGTHRGVKIRNTKMTYVTGGPAFAVSVSGTRVEDVDIDGISAEGTSAWPVVVNDSVVTGQLRVRNVTLTSSAGISIAYLYGNLTSVAHLVMESCYRDGINYVAGSLVNVDTSADIDRISLIGVTARRCKYAVNVVSSGGLPIHIIGSRIEGEIGVRVSGAAARIYTSGSDIGGGVAAVSGATIASNDAALRCDVGLLAKSLGDMAFNTNAARACGIGPVGYDGTAWKNLITGATY